MAQASVTVRLFSWVAILALGLLGGWLGIQAGDRELPTVVYSSEPMFPVVARGTDLRIEFYVLRRRACAVQADQFIYDKFNTRFILPDIDIKPGLKLGEERFVLPVRVPDEAEPGPATYRLSPHHSCNPLQRIFPIPGDAREVKFIVK